MFTVCAFDTYLHKQALKNNKETGQSQQGWHSGESTHLPQIWPRFDSDLNAIRGLSLLVLY